jgi:GTP-binding protein
MTNNNSKMVNIIRAEYIASAVKNDQFPCEKLLEIAFIGRSNVGKSSLINSLTRVRNLARVSGQPGKTQTINFFKLRAKYYENEIIKDFYLVDLPGYGYAKTGQANRKRWAAFIEKYLLSSKRLYCVCQLVDIRHEPMEADINMFKWLVENNLQVFVIATKADKISKNLVKSNIDRLKKAFCVPELTILPYSSTKNEGRSYLLDFIGQALVE